MADAGMIDETVAILAAGLRGPRRRRASLLREVRDGLNDAALAHRAKGLCGPDAELCAITEFGSATELAPLYQDELVAEQAHRTAVLGALSLLVTTWAWDVWSVPAGAGQIVAVTMLDVSSGIATGIALVAAALVGLGVRRRLPFRRLVAGMAVAGGLVLAIAAGTSVALLVTGDLGLPQIRHSLMRAAVTTVALAWIAWSLRRCVRVQNAVARTPTGARPVQRFRGRIH